MQQPMQSLSHRLLTLFLALSALVVPIAAAARDLPSPNETWIELRTADFMLYSNAGERKAREIGEDLERLRDALGQLAPGLVLPSPVPTSIFVFKDAISFQPYALGKVTDKGGYFLERQLASYVAIYLEIRGDTLGKERELFHQEYIRYLLRNKAATLPPWLHDGLAEYYSTLEVNLEVNKGEARVGLPPPQHVQWLRQHELIPLATLLAVDERSAEHDARSGGFPAESWLLVHYLMSDTLDRRGKAAELFRLAQAGTPPDRLFAAAFGAGPAVLAVLDAELRRYARSYQLSSTTLPIRPAACPAMTARPMPWPETLSRLGDLLGHLADDPLALAAEHFRAALAAQPAPAVEALALAGLGELAEGAGKAEEARALYERAAPLAPADPRVQFLLARSLLGDPGADSGPDADSPRRARSVLEKVVAMSPDFGEAWASLGSACEAEENLGAEEVTALEAAHRLLPARMDVAHNLALAYARTGQGQKAGEVIEHGLVPGGASLEEIENAREALGQRQAEELIAGGRTDEAGALLEALDAKTASPARREAIARRRAEIRSRQSFNLFVERYNRAVELANQGDAKGAAALLEPLLATTLDPTQAERARDLLERLRPPPRKGGK